MKRTLDKERADIKLLLEICFVCKEKKQLSDDHFARLKTIFGQRFSNAWTAVEESRVKRYVFNPSNRVVWVVVGRKRDYIVLPAVGFCSCDDFYFGVMEGKAFLCYHLIAQKIAESLGRYDQIEADDDLYEILMKEWKEVTS